MKRRLVRKKLMPVTADSAEERRWTAMAKRLKKPFTAVARDLLELQENALRDGKVLVPAEPGYVESLQTMALEHGKEAKAALEKLIAKTERATKDQEEMVGLYKRIGESGARERRQKQEIDRLQREVAEWVAADKIIATPDGRADFLMRGQLWLFLSRPETDEFAQRPPAERHEIYLQLNNQVVQWAEEGKVPVDFKSSHPGGLRVDPVDFWPFLVEHGTEEMKGTLRSILLGEQLHKKEESKDAGRNPKSRIRPA